MENPPTAKEMGLFFEEEVKNQKPNKRARIWDWLPENFRGDCDGCTPDFRC